MEKNINYTDMAVQKLDNAIAKLKKDIEKDIVKSKSYPGEDIIEITASDIEDAFDRVTIKSPKALHGKERSMLLAMLVMLYTVIGFFLITYLIVSDIGDRGIKIDGVVSVLTSVLISVVSVISVVIYLLAYRVYRIKNSEQVSKHLNKDESQARMMTEIFNHYIELKQKEDRATLEKEIVETMCDTIGKYPSTTTRVAPDEEENSVYR
ncbi:hypothetical protein CS543_05530 [Porphyromonas gingivalis]|uniref:hypothetical protein n=1 Tax=Porphyromonas gingivalis TaxID=837 RepID=UPI000974F8E4|nr:hypothetical protein [Porphyromonas gingivalis]ATS10360.1 hypothetical protein CS543_05530 [Porphyromonas gingivalis]SJL26199.1 hypothetical protein PGIN_7BTORR_01894 [Porphyromonas gingivalis]SJL33234.1 hypothetical protein PGIN_84-3_01986 [Porphyromonas gingivalis]